MSIKLPHLICCASLATLAMADGARAFTFTPMSVSFDPTGKGATQSFQVENDSTSKLALEVTMAHREMDEKGEEKVAAIPASEKLFLVYPTQLLLGPNEKRTIRVSWVGEKEPKKELAFRIIAEQLPVQTEKEGAGDKAAVIRMLLKYMGSVYITPRSAAPDVVLKSAARRGGRIKLVVENRGGAHQVFTRTGLVLKAGGKSVTLQPEELPQLNGQNMLPGKTRRFEIPAPKTLPDGNVEAALEQKS